MAIQWDISLQCVWRRETIYFSTSWHIWNATCVNISEILKLEHWEYRISYIINLGIWMLDISVLKVILQIDYTKVFLHIYMIIVSKDLNNPGIYIIDLVSYTLMRSAMCINICGITKMISMNHQILIGNTPYFLSWINVF